MVGLITKHIANIGERNAPFFYLPKQSPIVDLLSFYCYAFYMNRKVREFHER